MTQWGGKHKHAICNKPKIWVYHSKEWTIRYVTLILVATALFTGCATSDAQRASTPVYLTHQEYLDGIVRPTFTLIFLFGAYYVENGTTPENRNQLEAYASKAGMHIEWQNFPLVEFFQVTDKYVIRADIVSQSSATESGEIRTSWKFYLSETSSTEDNLRFEISPLSYVCVRGDPDPADTMGKLFLELVIGYLAKSPVQRRTESCFRPFSDQAGSTNQKSDLVKKKLDQKLKALQMKSRETPQGAN